MKLRDRVQHAEQLLSAGTIQTAEEYIAIIEGNDMDKLEDRIEFLQQYLDYKKSTECN